MPRFYQWDAHIWLRNTATGVSCGSYLVRRPVPNNDGVAGVKKVLHNPWSHYPKAKKPKFEGWRKYVFLFQCLWNTFYIQGRCDLVQKRKHMLKKIHKSKISAFISWTATNIYKSDSQAKKLLTIFLTYCYWVKSADCKVPGILVKAEVRKLPHKQNKMNFDTNLYLYLKKFIKPCQSFPHA